MIFTKGLPVDTKRLCVGFLLFVSPFVASAFQLSSLTPKGEVARVKQIVAGFDEAATGFGDARADAPVDLRCADGFVPKGAGRWLNERTWVFDFEEDLPPVCAAACKSSPD